MVVVIVVVIPSIHQCLIRMLPAIINKVDLLYLKRTEIDSPNGTSSAMLRF